MVATLSSADSTNSPNGTSAILLDGFVGDDFKARVTINVEYHDHATLSTKITTIAAFTGTLKVGDTVPFLNLPKGLTAKVASHRQVLFKLS